jgi:phosphoribosylformylglycinamidine synthase subunit PurQ / glutaminase
MKSAVIIFPGSNCDRDLAVAIAQISGKIVHKIWHDEDELPSDIDVIGARGDCDWYLQWISNPYRGWIIARRVDAQRGTFLCLSTCCPYHL